MTWRVIQMMRMIRTHTKQWMLMVKHSTTICKLVDLNLALHQSDCRIPNWVSAKTVLSYRNWPRYGLCWSGWYYNPEQHELCRPSRGRAGRHNECNFRLVFVNCDRGRTEIDHLYGLRCRGCYCNPEQHSLYRPARPQEAAQRPAQLVLFRIAVPTTPAQTVSWSIPIISYNNLKLHTVWARRFRLESVK